MRGGGRERWIMTVGTRIEFIESTIMILYFHSTSLHILQRCRFGALNAGDAASATVASIPIAMGVAGQMIGISANIRFMIMSR